MKQLWDRLRNWLAETFPPKVVLLKEQKKIRYGGQKELYKQKIEEGDQK